MAESSITIWKDLLTDATTRLQSAGIENAQVDAKRMIAEVAGEEMSQLHQLLDNPVTRNATHFFDALVARRIRGEPLQYVLGRWGFRTLDLMVDPRVLIPRPETETVAGLAIEAVQKMQSRQQAKAVVVADLGTGSGAIAASVAVECTDVKVHASDNSQDALNVARANLAGLGSPASVVRLHHGDWFEALPVALRGDLDVVVANPPYVAVGERLPSVVTDWEPEAALRSGADGLADLHQIVHQAPDWLAPKGVLVLETAPKQCHIVVQWCTDLGFTAVVREDLCGRSRAVVAQR